MTNSNKIFCIFSPLSTVITIIHRKSYLSHDICNKMPTMYIQNLKVLSFELCFPDRNGEDVVPNPRIPTSSTSSDLWLIFRLYEGRFFEPG